MPAAPGIKKRKPVSMPVTRKTVDSIWAIIHETQKLQRENKLAERELRKSQQETQQSLREIEKAQRETQKALQNFVQETERAHKEIEKAHKETEKAHKETERIFQHYIDKGEKSREEDKKSIMEMRIAVGHMGNRFGELAESAFTPTLKKKFQAHNFTFTRSTRHKRFGDVKDRSLNGEVDVFLENETQVMAVEVKTKLSSSDVADHSTRMDKLRRYADLHGDKRKFFGAIAAYLMDDRTRDYALHEGFYVIEPSGESIEILPPVPAAKVW